MLFEDGGGNIGLGTPTPAGKLDVSGAFYTTPGRILLRPQNNTTEGGELLFFGAGSNRPFTLDNIAGRLRLVSPDAGGPSEKFTILNNGNVGIGTSTPAGKLDVSGAFYTTPGRILLRPQNNTTEGGELLFFGAGTNRQFFLDNLAGRLRFAFHDGAAFRERMTILNDGSVGSAPPPRRPN